MIITDYVAFINMVAFDIGKVLIRTMFGVRLTLSLYCSRNLGATNFVYRLFQVFGWKLRFACNEPAIPWAEFCIIFYYVHFFDVFFFLQAIVCFLWNPKPCFWQNSAVFSLVNWCEKLRSPCMYMLEDCVILVTYSLKPTSVCLHVSVCVCRAHDNKLSNHTMDEFEVIRSIRFNRHHIWFMCFCCMRQFGTRTRKRRAKTALWENFYWSS